MRRDLQNRCVMLRSLTRACTRATEKGTQGGDPPFPIRLQSPHIAWYCHRQMVVVCMRVCYKCFATCF